MFEENCAVERPSVVIVFVMPVVVEPELGVQVIVYWVVPRSETTGVVPFISCARSVVADPATTELAPVNTSEVGVSAVLTVEKATVVCAEVKPVEAAVSV